MRWTLDLSKSRNVVKKSVFVIKMNLMQWFIAQATLG